MDNVKYNMFTKNAIAPKLGIVDKSVGKKWAKAL